MSKNVLFIILTVLLSVAVSCKENLDSGQPEAQEPPVLLSSVPADGATDVQGDELTVRLTFDRNIRCSKADEQKIKIDGGAVIKAVSASGAELSVIVSGLNPGASYVLSVPEKTIHGFNQDQSCAAAISIAFTMKKREKPPVPEGRMKPGEDSSGWENAALCVRNMGVGWNLGNTLESNSGDINHMWIEAWTGRTTKDYETAWGQPLATRELIHMFKLAGFNAIRVPVTWYPHMGKLGVTVKKVGTEDKAVWDPSTWTGYDVDPVWMARVKEVVDYVIDEGMYCILNVHHDTGDASTAWMRADEGSYERYKDRYISLWTQIATEFVSYGERLVFESFNEMLDAEGTWNSPKNGSSFNVINRFNADFVATVRATGGNNAHRNLILNTYAASCTESALKAFELPADTAGNHLCAEIHSYAPYQFAMVEGSTQIKFDAACEKEVENIIALAGKYLVDKGIPCVLGEYGTTSQRAEEEMCKQAACYLKNASLYDIPCFYWMTLSDAEDRTVPKWTKTKLKDTIIRTYKENYD